MREQKFRCKSSHAQSRRLRAEVGSPVSTLTPKTKSIYMCSVLFVCFVVVNVVVFCVRLFLCFFLDAEHMHCFVYLIRRWRLYFQLHQGFIIFPFLF